MLRPARLRGAVLLAALTLILGLAAPVEPARFETGFEYVLDQFDQVAMEFFNMAEGAPGSPFSPTIDRLKGRDMDLRVETVLALHLARMPSWAPDKPPPPSAFLPFTRFPLDVKITKTPPWAPLKAAADARSRAAAEAQRLGRQPRALSAKLPGTPQTPPAGSGGRRGSTAGVRSGALESSASPLAQTTLSGSRDSRMRSAFANFHLSRDQPAVDFSLPGPGLRDPLLTRSAALGVPAIPEVHISTSGDPGVSGTE